MDNLISALRVDLYDCNERPADILKRHWPTNFTRRAWIPQSLGDQIWVLFEFETVEARLTWEASLPPLIVKWLDRKLISAALRFGWKIRDYNGFEIEIGK